MCAWFVLEKSDVCFVGGSSMRHPAPGRTSERGSLHLFIPWFHRFWSPDQAGTDETGPEQ